MTVYADRVQEITTTTGTGTINLGGAVIGYQTFANAFASGTVVYYCITDGINWEVGYGAFTLGTPSTIARTVVLSSSNSGALVNFTATLMNIFCTLPASRAGGPKGSNGNAAFYEHDNTIIASYIINTGKNVVSAGPMSMNNNTTVTIPNGSTWAVV
jgi:hypothetical protein